MIEVKEILYRWNKGMSKKGIVKSLGVARNTVKRIVNQAEGFGLKRLISSNEEINEISIMLIEYQKKRPKNPNSVQARLSKWHDQLKEWIVLPNMTIIQMMRLLAEKKEFVSETSLRTYMKNHLPQTKRSTIHLITAPARQAQVDYGYVGMMLDPITKKAKRTYAFIMTLSHSRHRFVYFVFRQDVATWIDCHIRAFNFFNGVPMTILLDNLKAGVIKPDIYDPTINRSYAELERYYGFVADPAKVRKANHKGKVERSVTIVKQQLIAGRNYKDIQDANTYAFNWCRFIISKRVTKTTGEAPWERFIRDEKKLLLPLPRNDFECPIWCCGIVHDDHHIVFQGSFYSVPTKYISEEVWVRATHRIIQIFHLEKLIKTHVRATHKGQWITDPEDYPKEVMEFLAQTPKFCISMAKTIGESVHKVISITLEKYSITKQRKANGILRLAEQYGNARLNSACKRALAFDNLKYESIKKILTLDLDKEDYYLSSAVNTSEDAYLRDPGEFATCVEEDANNDY